MSLSANGLFASEYSAMTQRVVMKERYGRDEYVGQLRFDSLLARRIVVPDSQLLDGRFFLETHPAELRALIGDGSRRELPIRIKARRASLHDTLAVWLERPGSENLNGFPFNAIRSDSVRGELAAALRETKASVLRKKLRSAKSVPKAIATLLRELLRARGLEADEDLAVLERGWSLWLEEESTHRLIGVEQWDRPFDLPAAMELDPVDPSEDLGSERGRELYAELRRLAFRSDATSLLLSVRETATDAHELLDIETLSSWYTDARHRAFAMQHTCDFARSEAADGPAIGTVRRALQRASEGELDATTSAISAPPALVENLALLPGDDFGALVASARREMERWWQTGDPDDLSKLITKLESGVPTSNASQKDRPALAQLFAKAAAAGAGYLAGGAAWAIFAALLSEGILATRENVRVQDKRRTRRRIVEYGLMRLGSPHQ